MDRIPIIYVIGAGRSGSTLLDLIMDSHSRIVGVGELSNWIFEKDKQKKMPCSCGRALSGCEFWQKVFAPIPDNLRLEKTKLKVNQKRWNFLRGKKHFYFAANRQMGFDRRMYLELNRQIYQNIIACSGKSVVFDSSKEMDRAEALMMDNRFNILFVHLVRDGRGTTYSYKRKHGGLIRPMMIWFQNNLKAEIFKRRYKNRAIFVRYEDFCRNPQKEIARILSRMGMEFEPKMMNYRAPVHHQVDGNPLRLRDRHQEIAEDSAWRKELPRLDKFIFNLLFGWLNYYYQKIHS